MGLWFLGLVFYGTQNGHNLEEVGMMALLLQVLLQVYVGLQFFGAQYLRDIC